MTAPSTTRNSRRRTDGSRTPRVQVIVDEYVWLHETCGVPEHQVARQLGISENSLLDALRKAGHHRPARTLEAAAAASGGLHAGRARLGRW